MAARPDVSPFRPMYGPRCRCFFRRRATDRPRYRRLDFRWTPARAAARLHIGRERYFYDAGQAAPEVKEIRVRSAILFVPVLVAGAGALAWWAPGLRSRLPMPRP